MQTVTLRTATRRARAAAGLLAVLLTLPAPRSFAGEPPASPAPPAVAAAPAAADGEDRIFEVRLDAGYRAIDVDGDRSLLFPYDSLADGPILGFDLLYLTPGFGTLKLEAGYADGDTYRADLGFNHGSDIQLQAGTQSFTHARSHTGPVPSVRVDTPPPAGMDVEGSDGDPGRAYRDEHRETTAAAKVRVPGYPAHVFASGRIDRRGGERQMRNFFRSCSTHLCHADSRTRELDAETNQYTVGVDAHAGPVDLAYSHAAQTYRDNAADPLAPAGDFTPPYTSNLKGDVPYDVNPDLRSAADRLTLNTNLSNRMVLSLAFANSEQKNETSDVTRITQNAGADLTYRIGRSSSVTARYAYVEERSGDVGDAALAARVKRNQAQATTRHQHVLSPKESSSTGELEARFSPVAALDLDARLRYRSLERYNIIDKEGATFVDEADTTTSTLASVGGRYRLSPGLALDASLGREWTDGVVYAVETVGITRYGLGASWTPAPSLLLRVDWQGFRGKNDDQAALQHAYAAVPAAAGSPPERTVSGDAYMALATYTPAPAFTLTASWSLTDNGVEQDLLFGSPANAGFAFSSPDTSWSGRAQLADLRARWEVTKRVALTADGMWIDSLESYAPTFVQGTGLEEISRVEFTKLLASLLAELHLTGAVGLTVGAFWTKYDDQVEDGGDGTAQGLLAALSVRW